MVDNFKQIKSLLEFRSPDDFYFLQILQRKKDHNNNKVNGSNNNSRLVKAYYIHSLEYFDFIEPEVKELCKVFGARAGINLNRRSYEKTAFHTLRKVADQIMNRDYTHVNKAFNSVCGMYSNETDKRWLLDFDYMIEKRYLKGLLLTLHGIQPIGDKFIAQIPSKSGIHIISKPFNIKDAKQLMELHDFEVHKNNPTNLYIP